MRVIRVFIITILLTPMMNFIVSAQQLFSVSKEIETKIDTLLKQMTIEEKVGQMTQVTFDVIAQTDKGKVILPGTIDPKKLEDAILRYHVGSMLNVPSYFFTIDHWHDVITSIEDVATKQSRLKIPILYGIDAIHGATYTSGATLFPQSIGIAATWNKEFAKHIGEVTAIEVRASGIPWNFHPVLDLGRQPLWSRFWETLGEDPYLASTLGKEYVEGLQGNNIGKPEKVAACLKHYVGYGFPWSGKDRTPAYIDERMMREYFLPIFEAAIKAGAPTIMVNSAEVNGIPGHANYHLLTEVLRGELEFQGFVVSDWEDIKQLHTRDRVATSPKDAVRLAVMAGIDMSMVPYDYSFYELLLSCVKDGSVPQTRIDEAVRRIMRVKFQLGLFDNPYPNKTLVAQFAAKASTEFNIETAREAMTLLKNENNILPLSRISKVLVTGPTANLLSVLNGGWTITWQGDVDSLYPKNKPTILDAIALKAGKKNVEYVPGTSFDKVIDLQAAVKAAMKADVVVLCLGERTYCETPGNIEDLTLDEAQLQLADALAATKKPIVLVLAEGRPRIVNRIESNMRGVLMAYLPGMEGGAAVADVLYGDTNPSGKLPFTYPRHPNDLTPYDHKPLEAANENSYNPQWQFGFGLSYTTFAYSDLWLSKEEIRKDESLIASISVTNTGTVLGKEIVQLYLTDVYGQISRPVKQLKGFAKVMLQPGEKKSVKFIITPDEMSFIGLENKRIVEPGDFIVTIGPESKKFTVNAEHVSDTH